MKHDERCELVRSAHERDPRYPLGEQYPDGECACASRAYLADPLLGEEILYTVSNDDPDLRLLQPTGRSNYPSCTCPLCTQTYGTIP